MKKFLLLILAGFVSCGLEEVGRSPCSGSGNVWVNPGADPDVENTAQTVVHVTALNYPDGYDWRTDREKGTVKCTLVVYADGVPIMKVPVGDMYEVSSDPDMHRMVKGHLYTDYSTETETVIRRDGAEIIRYPAREMICDMVEKDGDVYTLGHSREGRGFSCRRNGEIIVGRPDGYSFGRLSHEGDSVCFTFREPASSSEESVERCYHVVNGEISQIVLGKDVTKVWDMVHENGEVSYLASVAGISSPVLFRSGEMKAMDMPEAAEILACRMFQADDVLYIEGLCRCEGKPLTSCVWDGNGRIHVFSEGMTVSSVCADRNSLCCILNGTSAISGGFIYRSGEICSMPAGYSSTCPSSAALIGGSLHVGLTSLPGTPPLLWKDGQTSPLPINGFISTILTSKENYGSCIKKEKH